MLKIVLFRLDSMPLDGLLKLNFSVSVRSRLHIYQLLLSYLLLNKEENQRQFSYTQFYLTDYKFQIQSNF